MSSYMLAFDRNNTMLCVLMLKRRGIWGKNVEQEGKKIVPSPVIQHWNIAVTY